MSDKEYIEYIEAVDIVCMNCCFGEDDCKSCPVRKTMDVISEKRNPT